MFLDEISELPRELQPKLLKVLKDGEFQPVGADKTTKVNVRILSASNQDLRSLVDAGLFRADLYYRIAVIPLCVPPLRDRPSDTRLLVDHFIERLAARGYPRDVRPDREGLKLVMYYPWPGNVRELANAIEHGVICAIDGVITADALPYDVRNHGTSVTRRGRQDHNEHDLLQKEIEEALERAHGNRTLAAQVFGIDRSTLWRRMQRLGMTWTELKHRCPVLSWVAAASVTLFAAECGEVATNELLADENR